MAATPVNVPLVKAPKLERSVEGWKACDPEAMANQSRAAVVIAFKDARHDILALADALHPPPDPLQLAAPELLAELQAAHQIILNALALMTPEQKGEWARSNARDGVIGEGTTRFHERAEVIAKAGGAS